MILDLLMQISALCVAISVHEWAHAFIAYKNGDPTAKVMGRMTLAPHAHFDLWGFLCFMFLGFGWAKGVPVNSLNFKKGKISSFWVSIAGILANIVIGIVAVLIHTALLTFKPVFMASSHWYATMLTSFLNYSVTFNFVLAFFNLLPLYPLDGFRMIESFCKPHNKFLNFMRRYSKVIIIALIIAPTLLNLLTLFIVPDIIDLYLNFTAGNVIDFLYKIFTKFFGAML